MTAQRDPDTILAAWLDEGPTELPSPTRRAILSAIPTMTQARRGPLAPWRLLPMNALARAAIGLAVLVAVAVGGISLIGLPGGTGSAASPSPAGPPTLPPGASPLPEPSLSGVFQSGIYGYFVEVPGDWSQAPATKPWTKFINSGADTPWIARGNASLDELTGTDARFTAWEQPIPAGQTPDQWLRNLGVGNGVCSAPSQLPESFPVGQSQGHTIVNGCPVNGGLFPGAVGYEVAVVYNGHGWDFNVDGRVDAAYVMRLLATVVFLPTPDMAPSAS